MEKKSLKDIVVMGKKVFVRVDYNVPMKDGVITNDNVFGEQYEDAARMFDLLTTSDDFVEFLTLPGYEYID